MHKNNYVITHNNIHYLCDQKSNWNLWANHNINEVRSTACQLHGKSENAHVFMLFHLFPFISLGTKVVVIIIINAVVS